MAELDFSVLILFFVLVGIFIAVGIACLCAGRPETELSAGTTDDGIADVQVEINGIDRKRKDLRVKAAA